MSSIKEGSSKSLLLFNLINQNKYHLIIFIIFLNDLKLNVIIF